MVSSIQIIVVNEWHAAHESSWSYLHRVVNGREHLPLLDLTVAIKDSVIIFLKRMLDEVAFHVANQMTIEANV